LRIVAFALTELVGFVGESAMTCTITDCGVALCGLADDPEPPPEQAAKTTAVVRHDTRFRGVMIVLRFLECLGESAIAIAVTG
jgi:hypothetical protein